MWRYRARLYTYVYAHVRVCTHASNLEAPIIYAHSAAYSHFVAVRRVWPNSNAEAPSTLALLPPTSSSFPPYEFDRIRKSRQLTIECRYDNDYRMYYRINVLARDHDLCKQRIMYYTYIYLSLKRD